MLINMYYFIKKILFYITWKKPIGQMLLEEIYDT